MMRSILWILLLGFFAFSCSNEPLQPASESFNSNGLRISMGGPLTRSADAEVVLGEMRLYCFDRSALGGTEPGNGTSSAYEPVGIAHPGSPFHHIVQGLTKNNMTLYTHQMRVGKWDLALVANQGATITAPIAAHRADQLLLYTFDPAQNSGLAHEFYHNYCRLPEVTANNHPYANASVSRNVAKIRVVIERAVDVNTAAPVGSHTVTLDGIPKYISWAGTLLKNTSGSFTSNKDDYDVFPNGTPAFVKNIAFTPAAEAGTYQSDTLDYIIPAYRGTDFWRVNPTTNMLEMNPAPIDTLTRKMTLSVNFSKPSGGVFTKSVTVPVVAKCNQILLLKVRMQDVQVELKPEVKNWETQSVNGNMKAAYLNVSNAEATIYDGSVSRIYFWSNQPADSVYVTRAGVNGSTAIADIDTQLDRLAGATAVNRYYNPATQSGYIDLSNLTLAASQSNLKIYLKAGGLQREIIVKRNVSDQALAAISTPYVGTFHRWNQTGERMITWNYTGGAWTAYIDQPSGSGADVLIDRLASPAMQENTLYGSTLTDPEQYRVTQGGRSVIGQNRIYFRIGWRTNAPNPAQPRYATVTIRKGTNDPGGQIIQTLYLRQGEEADYLMRPSDAVNSGGMNSTTRPDAVKVAPYNLTDRNMNVGGANVSDHNPLSMQSMATGENRFVDYPTQAGAFFQWAVPAPNERRAYHPINPTGAVGSWPNSSPNAYWSTLGAANETCPAGYRRPNDGATNGISPETVAESEMRQSLLLKPNSGPGNSNNTLENTVWGYYADGFFDRRAIQDALGSNAATNAAVSNQDKNIAYAGRLFFNPHNQASLFFPAAGYRHYSNGFVDFAGADFYHWSSSATATNNGEALSYQTHLLSVRNSSRYSGFSVRCVLAELNATPQAVLLSSTAGNTSKTITVNSSTPWTLTGLPTNASVSPTSGGAGATTVTLTRNNNAYGKSTLTIRNTGGRTEHVLVESLYITPDELWLNNNLPGVNTKDFDIIVWGGSEDWNIVPGSYPGWLTPTKLPNGKLRLAAQQYTLSDEREGTITISHADDPNYTTTFTVIQMVYSDIPPFRYFVAKVTWPNGPDVDIAVEFSGNYVVNAAGNPTGTRVPFDSQTPESALTKAMGWSFRPGLNLDGSIVSGTTPSQAELQNGLAFWGGDAQTGQGETVFFNAPLITPAPGDYRNNPLNLPRRINMNVYVTWYNGTAGEPITVSFYTYEGGVMAKGTGSTSGEANVYNFYNVDHTGVIPNLSPNNIRPHSFFDARTKNIHTIQGNGNYRTGYTLFCTITYDRWTRSATINWNPVAPLSMNGKIYHNPATKKD